MEGWTLDSTIRQDILENDASMEASYVTIGVASPEVIKSWSHGEVKTPETINYRTFKPEKGGLFCEKIFGPTKDWECACGKYKRIKHKGVTCDRCGVEVTQSRVRRERMGHLELAVPVSHIWFFKCLPSKIGSLLDIQSVQLEKVLYYENYIVTDPGDTQLQLNQTLTEEEYRDAKEMYGNAFKAGMGAEAVQTLLKNLDLASLQKSLSDELRNTHSKSIHQKLVKRIRLVEGFLQHDMKPEWMILTVLPVIPPDLRPLVPLDGGRFATSDLNDLYRRVINRNNRLKNMKELSTPEVIIQNEKRMLQEAVDALLDNGRHGRAVTGNGNRQLKSLSDMLKGKQGRFRKNLLGKRVDYSGRSVIVVGPELRINQCGLPKAMALTLFEPFIIAKLKQYGYVTTVRNAKKWIEQRRKEVWDILDEVTKGHPILLNRAPTLHRLSIQAFDPILIEGQAIRLHPLVCTAFNADFDGDQMAVHVPLSNEAQLEAKLLMLSPNNIFSPASGKPITTPSQDITLGVYYLNYEDKRKRAKFESTPKINQPVYNDISEVLRAKQAGAITMHDFFNLKNPFYGKDTTWCKSMKDKKFIVTTAGRCIFNEIWPEEMGFYDSAYDEKNTDKHVGKKEIGRMIKDCYETVGRAGLIKLLDRLKDLGYEYATWAGFSIGIQDMIVPPEKKEIVAKTQAEIDALRKQQYEGVITEQERYNRAIDCWEQANKDLSQKLATTLSENLGRDEINPVWAMLDSGARGSVDQIRQLAGMRGLMARPSGQIIETPILANFREGLTVLEYFISSHGARKGLADTALKTADSGYMTRKLVDVAHDVICTEEDCHTVNGIWLNVNEDELDRIAGRFSVDDVYNPRTGEIIVEADSEITTPLAKKILAAGVDRVHIRSVLTCESENGICAKCYGRNLATGDMPLLGDPVGIIAAQSIGEPGTQLTMRTFHFGGTASAGGNNPFYEAEHDGILRLEVTPVKTREGNYIVINKNGRVVIENENEEELESYELVAGATLTKTTGDRVKKGERFVTWDPYNEPIITNVSGTVNYHGLVEGVTFKRETNRMSGKEEIIVMEVHQEDIHPTIEIIPDGEENVVETKAKKGSKKTAKTKKTFKQADGSVMEVASYSLLGNAHILVERGARVEAGDTIAKTPRQSKKTTDITGGLPRVAELFEARRPHRAAEIARIDGLVSIERSSGKGGTIINITDAESSSKPEAHKIPAGKQIIVNNGDYVTKGTPLTNGDVVLHDMLEVCGQQEMQEHMVNQVQQVYRKQHVEINDKHIEIIVRQMMRRVRINNPGTTKFLDSESVDKQEFLKENERVLAEGGVPADATPMLQGITKAALATDSFISAASFQDTTRVLTEAATLGRTDHLRGFKENVIMGHLIPAGTGFPAVQNFKLEYAADDGVLDGVVPQEHIESQRLKKGLDELNKFLKV